MSIMTSRSPLNAEIMDKIKLLDSKGMNSAQIMEELKLVYGNHVIANKRDRFKRSEFDY